jgi:hypothetical protein
MRSTAFAFMLCLTCQATFAAPVEDSCRVLAVIGQNDTAKVEEVMIELADRWTEANRTGAIETLKAMLDPAPFSGGSVYRIAKIGDDLEEHLVVLRLSEGEIAGMRLLYEWTPDGLKLTSLDFKRRYADIISAQIMMPPEPIDCP